MFDQSSWLKWILSFITMSTNVQLSIYISREIFTPIDYIIPYHNKMKHPLSYPKYCYSLCGDYPYEYKTRRKRAKIKLIIV